jgi:hypothetical protein
MIETIDQLHIQELTIGGKTKKQLKDQLRRKGVVINPYARGVVNSPDFTVLQDPTTLKITAVTPKELGFHKEREIERVFQLHTDRKISADEVMDLIFQNASPGMNRIYQRAAQLGLGLCPAEVALYLPLSNIDLTQGFHNLAMKPVNDRNGIPFYLTLYTEDNRICLDSLWARPNTGRGTEANAGPDNKLFFTVAS